MGCLQQAFVAVCMTDLTLGKALARPCKAITNPHFPGGLPAIASSACPRCTYVGRQSSWSFAITDDYPPSGPRQLKGRAVAAHRTTSSSHKVTSISLAPRWNRSTRNMLSITQSSRLQQAKRVHCRLDFGIRLKLLPGGGITSAGPS